MQQSTRKVKIGLQCDAHYNPILLHELTDKIKVRPD